MSYAIQLHHFIDAHNVLKTPTQRASEYFKKHPMIYKIALLVNHVFRVASMTAFLLISSLSLSANACICLAGSIFYRLSVENNCAYKFALPSLAGAFAFLQGQAALKGLIKGSAFASAYTFSHACISLLPLAAYAAYIALTVNYDVDQR